MMTNMFTERVPMVFAVDDYNFFKDYTHYSIGDLERFHENDYKPKKIHANEYVLTRGLDRILLQNAVRYAYCNTNVTNYQ